jgi:hypothetical protein
MDHHDEFERDEDPGVVGPVEPGTEDRAVGALLGLAVGDAVGGQAMRATTAGRVAP